MEVEDGWARIHPYYSRKNFFSKEKLHPNPDLENKPFFYPVVARAKPLAISRVVFARSCSQVVLGPSFLQRQESSLFSGFWTPTFTGATSFALISQQLFIAPTYARNFRDMTLYS
jgi:hypothetical protein